MTKQTLEQQRAQDTWNKSKGCKDDYMKLAKGLPALIMNSGLMQVMAFLNQKGGAHEVLAAHLRKWLHANKGTREDFEGFMEDLMSADPRKFQEITAEAFAWLRWMRQMAAARVGGE